MFTKRSRPFDLPYVYFFTVNGQKFRRYLSKLFINVQGERPYPCNLCDKGFRSKQELQRHRRRVHMGSEALYVDKYIKPVLCLKAVAALLRSENETSLSESNSHVLKSNENYDTKMTDWDKKQIRENLDFTESKDSQNINSKSVDENVVESGKCNQSSELPEDVKKIVEAPTSAKVEATSEVIVKSEDFFDDNEENGNDSSPLDCKTQSLFKNELSEAKSEEVIVKCEVFEDQEEDVKDETDFDTNDEPSVQMDEEYETVKKECNVEFKPNEELEVKCEALEEGEELPHEMNGSTKIKSENGENSQAKDSSKPYKCDVCNRYFKEKKNLNRHKKKSKTCGKKYFFCKKCDEKFSQKVHLKEHMITHKKQKLKKETKIERTYCCDACGKSFGTKEHLKRHRITHTGSGLYFTFSMPNFG